MKRFFDVFPTLEVKSDLRDYFDETQVERLTTNKEHTRIKIVLHSGHLIHKSRVFRMQYEIAKQVFANSPKWQETFKQRFAVVDDDHIEVQPMERLREKYPNIIGTKQLFLSENQAGDFLSDETRETREKIANNKLSDEELVRSFLKSVCDTVPTDEDIAFFNMIKNKLGDEEK